jgi:hypothetical protein
MMQTGICDYFRQAFDTNAVHMRSLEFPLDGPVLFVGVSDAAELR